MTSPVVRSPADSAALAAAIRGRSFAGDAVTIVGFGNMGRQYLKAVQALGVRSVRVCSRSPEPLHAIADAPGVTVAAGGFEQLRSADRRELGIVAVPIALLVPAARHLVRVGFRRLLIEKPVSLYADEIGRFAEELAAGQVDARCAYNRASYPAISEMRARASIEGGITSCTYAFTEMIAPEWQARMPPDVLARWGIANSLHVMSLAHSLIGMPATWKAYRSRSLPWHPTGATFVGAGVSSAGVPFSYQADWGSKGRWAAEVHTAEASYRLCPLEQAQRKSKPLGEWEPVPITVVDASVKAGFVEQVAACLAPHDIPLDVPNVHDAAVLTAYAEDVFGYQ